MQLYLIKGDQGYRGSYDFASLKHKYSNNTKKNKTILKVKVQDHIKGQTI